MEYPKVSVNVVTCNRPEMLKECLASIYSQIYPNIELIVIDDSISRQGMSKSRNKGIARSTGEYVYLIDDDDFISDENAISKVVSFSQENNYDVVCSNYFVQSPDKNDTYISYTKHGDLLKEQCYPHGGTLWKREKMPKYNEEEDLGADLQLYLDAQKNGLKIGILDETLWTYRVGHPRMSDFKKETKESCERILTTYQH